MSTTRKHTTGSLPKPNPTPFGKPFPAQASLRMLLPESILCVFLLFLVAIMLKRIGMDNEAILYTTSATFLPLLFKPLVVSLSTRLHVCRSATRLGFCLAFASLLAMAHSIKNPSSSIRCASLFSLSASLCLICSTRPFLHITKDLPGTVASASWRKCAVSYEIALIALMGGLVILAGVLEVYTRQPGTSWAVVCILTALFLLPLTLCRHFRVTHSKEDGTCNTPFFPTRWHNRKHIASQVKRLWHTACIVVCFLPLFFSLRLLPLFLLDRESAGGLGLSTSDIGLLQGCIAVAGLLVGASIGRCIIRHFGLRPSLVPLSPLLSLINALCILLAYQQFTSLPLVGLCLFLACCGAGASSVSLLKWQIRVSDHNAQNIAFHVDITTAAAGLILSGLISAHLLILGYLNAFILLTCLLAPLSLLASAIMRSRLPK